MVRVNLIEPNKLADQHLIAEYNEILMLLGYVKRNPAVVSIPEFYVLGPGHIRFFKNKLLYLKNRHESIKQEMIKRRFTPTKSIDLSIFDKVLIHDWKPREKDYTLIKARLREKLRKKPTWYRYYGQVKTPEFLIGLLQ